MPNWCSNTLTVSTIDKSVAAKAELKKFISDVSDPGTILLVKDAEKFRKKYLKDHLKTNYRDAAELYVEHASMPIKKFMTQVAKYNVNKNKDYALNASHFSMDKLLPCPAELTGDALHSWGGPNGEENDKLREKMKAKHGAENGNDWHCNNWGCKWDVDATIDDETETFIQYTFESAWSPPTKFIENICENYLLLSFHLSYSEPGNNFEGDFEVEEGEVTRDDEREYSGGENEDDDEINEDDE